ncbi:MAG: hypothetical protein SCH66_11745 [Methanolobus sp.]|nr:hypothetical protein [Methanolobus sp.]
MISQLRVFLGIRNAQNDLSFNYPKNPIEDESRQLLTNPHYFFIFMLSVIFGVLIYYRATVDEIIPTIVLSVLWIIFWKNSEQKGRIFLVIASVFGYIHELLGVRYGYFTYLGGFIGGSPIWLIPGYGTIFWSSYNLWKGFEERYSAEKWFGLSNYFVAISLAAIFAVDYLVFDMSENPVGILIKFSLAFMLFRTFEGVRLAYFVAFFTVLTEFTGEMLGTWYHPDFSLLSLMAGYVFLLWVCLTLDDISKGNSSRSGKESLAAVVLTTFYVFTLLGVFSV